MKKYLNKVYNGSFISFIIMAISFSKKKFKVFAKNNNYI